jgi:hypothetical protein
MDEAEVEVVYALARGHDAVTLRVSAHATLREAITASGILERHTEIDLARCRIGVFGKIRRPDDRVAPGDRIEIYRPLLMDPKEARRRRARRF